MVCFGCVCNILFTEDEGSRVKGRRIALLDLSGKELTWNPFNGTWINGKNKTLLKIDANNCSTYWNDMIKSSWFYRC